MQILGLGTDNNSVAAAILTVLLIFLFIVLYLYYNLTVLKMKQKLFILGDSHFGLGKMYRLGRIYRLGTVHTGYMQILGLGTDNNSVVAAIPSIYRHNLISTCVLKNVVYVLNHFKVIISKYHVVMHFTRVVLENGKNNIPCLPAAL